MPDEPTAPDTPLEAPEGDPVDAPAAPEPEVPREAQGAAEDGDLPTRTIEVEVPMVKGTGEATIGEFAGSLSNPRLQDDSAVTSIEFEHVVTGVTLVRVKAKGKDGPLVLLLDVND